MNLSYVLVRILIQKYIPDVLLFTCNQHIETYMKKCPLLK